MGQSIPFSPYSRKLPSTGSIWLVYVGTRILAIVLGLGCIAYVNFTLALEEPVRSQFSIAAFAFTVLAAVITSIVVHFQTRHLQLFFRSVSGQGHPSIEAQQLAANEALNFPQRHLRFEILVDPLITVLPICSTLWFLGDASSYLIVQVAVAGFLGLTCIIIATFLYMEWWMQRVIVEMREHGVHFDFDGCKVTGFRNRLQIGFVLMILMTAVMISGLAIQRILKLPGALSNTTAKELIWHTTLITFIAVTIGVVYSHFVIDAVTSRIARLMGVMRDVQRGDLSRRVHPTGADEISMLSRQFDAMVNELQQSDQQLRELKDNLEQLVHEKTSELLTQNQNLESALTQNRLMQEQLVHSEKMTSLGQLVSGLAHEINNSINVVHTGLPALVARIDRVQATVSQLACTDSEIDVAFNKIHQLTQAIREGAERTAQIVRDMKQYAHPGTEGHVTADINLALQRCLNLLQVQRCPQLRVELTLEDVPKVTGKLSQLDQVFLNLISNAIDAMQEQGKLGIETQKQDDCVVIKISDSGPGISPDNIRKIFDPFFTTKAPGKGTGLGLSISYGIIDRCGGEIQCQSELGSGTTFLIRIPIEPSTASTVTNVVIEAKP